MVFQNDGFHFTKRRVYFLRFFLPLFFCSGFWVRSGFWVLSSLWLRSGFWVGAFVRFASVFRSFLLLFRLFFHFFVIELYFFLDFVWWFWSCAYFCGVGVITTESSPRRCRTSADRDAGCCIFMEFVVYIIPKTTGWFFKTMGFISQNDAYIFWGGTPLFFVSGQYFLSALLFVSRFRLCLFRAFDLGVLIFFVFFFFLGFVWWLLLCVYFCIQERSWRACHTSAGNSAGIGRIPRPFLGHLFLLKINKTDQLYAHSSHYKNTPLIENATQS